MSSIIPDASAAAKRSLNVQDGLKKKQLDIIAKAVDRACTNGERQIYIYDPVLPAIISYLVALGYRVEEHSYKNETTYTISW